MMLQQTSKIKIYFYIFSFLILTSIINNNYLKVFSNYFLVKNINVETNNIDIEKKILNKILFIKKQNIFFVKEIDIENEIENLNFLEDINIKKIYPSTIIVEAQKTNIKAITFISQKKYYVGENGEFISSEKINNELILPTIFGKFDILDFKKLNKILIKKNIDNKNIKKYYYHKNKRWDLYFKNNILIKLPHKNIENAITIFDSFLRSKKLKPNMVIDLRIPNRVILKNI